MLSSFWYIFWSFGEFFTAWYVAPRKIWQTCSALVSHLEENLKNGDVTPKR
jgi:hypothetical protein